MHLFKKTPEDDKTSIGNAAIELGYVTADDLKNALHAQRDPKSAYHAHPLGEVFVHLGVLRPYQLERLLIHQKVGRRQITKAEAAKQALRHQSKHLREVLDEMRVVTGRAGEILGEGRPTK
jgi:hypothetical protein